MTGFIIFQMAVLMFLAHYVCDFALQSDWMAKNKNPFAGTKFWYHVMAAHCATHALAVYLIGNSLLICSLEFVAHFAIDVLKMRGKLTFNQDQWLHLTCKVLWLVVYSFLNW